MLSHFRHALFRRFTVTPQGCWIPLERRTLEDSTNRWHVGYAERQALGCVPYKGGRAWPELGDREQASEGQGLDLFLHHPQTLLQDLENKHQRRKLRVWEAERVSAKQVGF